MVEWTPLILFPLVVLLFGMLGGLITSKKIPVWYQYLIKPKLNPPNWIFAPVWTTLYLMIGFSGYLAYVEDGTGFSEEKKTAWIFYFSQLFLNFLWTPLFFGLNWLVVAGIEVFTMDICIVFNIVFFSKINEISGLLLVPYCLWVSFATYLNWAIWYLNRKEKQR